MRFKLRRLFAKLRGRGTFVGRFYACDDAFKYRMGAGFPGDVNRTHPASVEPVLISVTNPPTAYGQAVVIDAADPNRGIRPLVAGDNGLTGVYGILVRPFPLQPATASQPFGGTQATGGAISSPQAPPTSGAADVLRQGYMMVQTNVGSVPTKGGAVFIWVAATSGNHIQGQYESAANGGNTIPLTAAGSVATFNGPADANGIAEVVFNV